MRRQFRFHQLSALALLLIFALANFSAGQDKAKKEKVIPEGTPLMWREPVDIASRDLYLGSGGEAMKPDLSSVTLIKEEKGGYSTKYRVRDGSGREWVAKVGKEAQPETAAVRLMWGVGFFLRYRLSGSQRAHRGSEQDSRKCALWSETKRYQTGRSVAVGQQPFYRQARIPGIEDHDGPAQQLGH